MRTVKCLVLAALVFALVGVGVAEEKKDLSIKEVMKKFHSAPKGETPVCGKVAGGKASEDDLKAIISGYEALTKATPAKGDEASWKEKTTALLTAAKDVAAKKEGAADAYKKAVNCKGCHTIHK
jgi:hypothetical protein